MKRLGLVLFDMREIRILISSGPTWCVTPQSDEVSSRCRLNLCIQRKYCKHAMGHVSVFSFRSGLLGGKFGTSHCSRKDLKGAGNSHNNSYNMDEIKSFV